MRIAFFTELYWPSRGGQEFRYGRLAATLSRAGHRCEIFTADHTGGALPTEERLDGIDVVRYLSLRSYVSPCGRSVSGAARYALATAEELRHRGPEYDAVIVNQMPLSHLPLLARELPIVIDWCEYSPSRWFGAIERWQSRRFRRNLAVDGSVVERLGIAADSRSWKVVHTPLDRARYTAGPKDPTSLLSIGRLVAHKNVESLLAAVVLLNERDHDPRELYVIGDGPLRSHLVERFGRYRFIHLMGSVDEATKLDLLRRAYLLALPSLREGLPNAALEAVASGTPIVTTNAAENGLKEFVRTHQVGVVAGGVDSEALAAAIHTLTASDWVRFVERACELSEKLETENSAPAIAAFLGGEDGSRPTRPLEPPS